MHRLKKELINLFLDYLPAMLFILFVLLFFATGSIKTALIGFGLIFIPVVAYFLIANFRSARKKIKRSLFELFLDWLPATLFITFALLWIITRNPVASAIIVGLLSVAIVATIRIKRRQTLLRSGVDVIDGMSGEIFEELLLEHFRKLGYKVKMTNSTADYGADLILEKSGERIVVQAKRWKGQVGIKSIQQAIAAIKHYDCNKGMVISNSYFTRNAKILAKSNNIEIWDRDDLIPFLSKAHGRELVKNVVKQHRTDLCPKCSSTLLLKNGKYGKFWGCSGFPRCRFSRSYARKIEDYIK